MYIRVEMCYTLRYTLSSLSWYSFLFLVFLSPPPHASSSYFPYGKQISTYLVKFIYLFWLAKQNNNNCFILDCRSELAICWHLLLVSEDNLSTSILIGFHYTFKYCHCLCYHFDIFSTTSPLPSILLVYFSQLFKYISLLYVLLNFVVNSGI